VKDTDSLLNWYKMLIELRRSNPTMHDGALTMLATADDKVLSWSRQVDGQAVVVVACNFTAETRTVDLSGQGKQAKTLMKSPGMGDPASLDKVELPAFGVYIGQIK
jgi:glycosidase